MGGKNNKNRKPSLGSKGNTKLHSPKRKSLSKKKSDSTKTGKKKVKQTLREPITARRLWVFRLIAVTVIPVLLFLLFEGILRVAGYGFPSGIIIKSKINGQDYYNNNLRFSWQFFPPQIAKTCDSFTFPVKKAEDTYRIFIMGASAAAGTPDNAFCFGRILQVMLKQQYPQENFEVITAAIPAINSHVVMEIARDCSKHEADLFIVYLGNNEVVGPYGAGTVFAPLSSNLSLIRFGIKFKATKTGQLLTNLLSLSGGKDTPEVWRGLAMFLDKQVRADDANLEIVYRHFQRNLEDICNLASKNGIPVIFSTVTSNLKDNPPFASLHRGNLSESEEKSWDTFYREGIKYETDGNYSAAVEQYLKANEIDSTFADLQFRLGKCFWALEYYEKSREKYVQARELDTLRFRADNRINDIIRNVASNEINKGVYFVDAMKMFEEKSPQGITGKELFHEHVHMNFSGNYLLAQIINQKVQDVLPERIKRNKTNELEIPSEAECARYLAYTDWEKYRITDTLLSAYIKRPPFTNQLYHNERVSELEKNIRDIQDSFTTEALIQIEAQYNWAIKENPSDWILFWKYGEFLERQDKNNEAARQFRTVLNYVPYNFEAFAKVGLLSGLMGDLDGAIKNNLEALKLSPFFPEAHFNLGLAYQFQGNPEKAIGHYSKAIQLKHDYGQAYNNLGAIYYHLDRVDQAIEIYRRGLEQVPNDWDMHHNLGILLNVSGQKDEAIKEFKKALQIDPNSKETQRALTAIEKSSS